MRECEERPGAQSERERGGGVGRKGGGKKTLCSRVST